MQEAQSNHDRPRRHDGGGSEEIIIFRDNAERRTDVGDRERH